MSGSNLKESTAINNSKSELSFKDVNKKIGFKRNANEIQTNNEDKTNGKKFKK